MSVPRRLGAPIGEYEVLMPRPAHTHPHYADPDNNKGDDGSPSSTHTHTSNDSHSHVRTPSSISVYNQSLSSTSSTVVTPTASIQSLAISSQSPSSGSAFHSSHSNMPHIRHHESGGGGGSMSGPTTVIHSQSSSQSFIPFSSSSSQSSPIGSPLLTRRSSSKGSSYSKMFTAPLKAHLRQQLQQEAMMMDEGKAATGSHNHADTLGISGSGSPTVHRSPGASVDPRTLYSPKSSPGVRANVTSPAPSPSNPNQAVSYNDLPAIDRVHRYVVTGTLQQSLFGVVKLAFDRVLKCQVAIKISRRERAQSQQTRSGVSVLENVRREAAVMQYLHERSASGQLNRCSPSVKKSLYAEMFANLTVNEILNNVPALNCSSNNGSGQSQSTQGKKSKRFSLSSRALHAHNRSMNNTGNGSSLMLIDDIDDSVMASDSENGSMTPSLTALTRSLESRTASLNDSSTPCSLNSTHSSSFNPLNSPSSNSQALQQQLSPPYGPLDSTDLEGERYICRYIEEMEDDYFHYLVTEFVPAGDLYSMLTSFPNHRLNENQARGLFRQMVLGVKYLHLRNVAHLDMSLENMCLDMEDNIRIIDFGVSALHPFTPTAFNTNYFSFPSASSPIAFPSMKPQTPAASDCGSDGESKQFKPFPHRAFLCKPVKELYAKPGKIRYMSPELFQGMAWDAFANDVFSLGVILYSLLTGRPPFQQAESSDLWFHVIYSGQWLSHAIRKQASAHVFTHLSEQALDLINLIIKPQEVRPTCEQILQHPFMLSRD